MQKTPYIIQVSQKAVLKLWEIPFEHTILLSELFSESELVNRIFFTPWISLRMSLTSFRKNSNLRKKNIVRNSNENLREWAYRGK